MAQWYCYVGGRQYGPVPDDVLREWAAAGRVGPRDAVWTEGMSDWAPASTVPGLFVGPLPSQAAYYAPAPSRYARPHRGGAVLALGILGLVFCILCGIVSVVCGIVAWAMGSADLREMRAGRMDPSGESMTRAGMICGIIATVLSGLWLLLVLFALLSSA